MGPVWESHPTTVPPPRDEHQGWLGGAGGLTITHNGTHDHHKEWLASPWLRCSGPILINLHVSSTLGTLFLAFQFSDEKTGLERGRDLPKAMKQAQGGSEAQRVWVQSPYSALL